MKSIELRVYARGMGASSLQRSLQQHAKHADSNGFFYGKWTGSIQILQKGFYVFDLDLGFDSTSSMKINGQARDITLKCGESGRSC